MPLTTLSCSAQPHDPEPPVIRVRCSSTELQLQPLCACRLRGTVALVAALPKPARGLGHSVTIHMAGEIACADLGDKVPALAGMSFVQWGEDVPPPLSPTTGIDGPWLARLGLAAPAPPRRFPLPPSLPGVLGRPCSGRWHCPRPTGALEGIRTMGTDRKGTHLNSMTPSRPREAPSACKKQNNNTIN